MFDYEYDKNAIIRELGIEASDAEFKAHVLIRIDQLLDQRMSVRVESELTDEQLQKFNDAENLEAARAFLKEQLPNIDEMYQEELDSIVGDLKLTLEA